MGGDTVSEKWSQGFALGQESAYGHCSVTYGEEWLLDGGVELTASRYHFVYGGQNGRMRRQKFLL